LLFKFQNIPLLSLKTAIGDSYNYKFSLDSSLYFTEIDFLFDTYFYSQLFRDKKDFPGDNGVKSLLSKSSDAPFPRNPSAYNWQTVWVKRRTVNYDTHCLPVDAIYYLFI